MRRLGVEIVSVALLLAVFTPTPARAGGVWDPNEPIHRLDIRWIGAYEQPSDGLLRVTVVFYDRLQRRWFGPVLPARSSSMVVRFESPYDQIARMAIGRGGPRLVAAMCESVGCVRSRVARPNPFTIRAWFDVGDLFFSFPHAGWRFRGRSARGTDASRTLDLTQWGTVT
jgi:hypothetical protein